MKDPVKVILSEEDWYKITTALRETKNPIYTKLGKDIEEQVHVETFVRDNLNSILNK